jgi:hypothetical protein
MQMREISWANMLRYIRTTSNSDRLLNTQPSNFSIHAASSDTYEGLIITFDGIPSTGSYYVYTCNPQEEMTVDGEHVKVPWRPVVNLALLYALDERGEEIGEPGSKAWKRYETSLADAIALDAHSDSYKATFQVP